MRDELLMDEAFADDAGFREALRARSPRPRWRAALAAIVSLSVLLVLVVWAYRLSVRDPMDVPVIRAAEGPAKMRPEDPGGAVFEHQGRAVYGALSGETTEPTEVALAPAAEPLAAEDAPAAALRAQAEAEAQALGLTAVEVAEAPVTPVDAEESPQRQPQAETLATEPFASTLVEPSELAPVFGAPAPKRPAERLAAASRPPAPEPVAAAPAAARPAPAASDGAQIQLGAYLTPEDAQRMWAEITRRNGDLLAGRQLVLTKLEQNGRTLHLLRAGSITDRSEAQALCVALKARGEDCLVPGD